MLTVHEEIWFVCSVKILRALRFKNSYRFLKNSPYSLLKFSCEHHCEINAQNWLVRWYHVVPRRNNWPIRFDFTLADRRKTQMYLIFPETGRGHHLQQEHNFAGQVKVHCHACKCSFGSRPAISMWNIEFETKCHHFAKDISKFIYLNEHCCILVIHHWDVFQGSPKQQTSVV